MSVPRWTKEWPPYQPVWFNGAEHGASLRDCDTRYRAIRHEIRVHMDYQKITAIDFGCYGPYFGTRLCEDFNADVIAVDDSRFLVDAYRPPLRGSLLIVPARLGVPQVMNLGLFHVGLCLSVLHHLTQWRDYLDALRLQTKLLFVETSHPEEELPDAPAQFDAVAIERRVMELGGRALCVTPGYDSQHGRTLWVLKQ